MGRMRQGGQFLPIAGTGAPAKAFETDRGVVSLTASLNGRVGLSRLFGSVCSLLPVASHRPSADSDPLNKLPFFGDLAALFFLVRLEFALEMALLLHQPLG